MNEFGTLAESAECVPKLRELILELAVRGTLVEQDANDEAADFAQKINPVEKNVDVKDSQIQKDKKFVPTTSHEPPWGNPKSWRWGRLRDVFEIYRGGSPHPAGNPQFFGGPIPGIAVREVIKDNGMYLIARW